MIPVSPMRKLRLRVVKERARNHPGSPHSVCAGHPCILLPPHPFDPASGRGWGGRKGP